MRQYALKLEKMGISYDRYRELVHYCRQYQELSGEKRQMIEEAATKVAGEFASVFLKNICMLHMPYRYLEIPYSESQFKRMRRTFFITLHHLKTERECIKEAMN